MIWQLFRGLDAETLPFVLVQLAAAITVMLLCLSFHEFAHAWMAKKMGDDTAQMHGRLTMDPFKHMDPFGALLFLVIGVGYAKPVPVNPRKFRNRKKGTLLVSLAGPGSNLLLAFPLALLLSATMVLHVLVADEITQLVVMYAQYVLWFNIMLMIFNLLPVPPLDGFHVLDLLLPMRASLRISQYMHIIRWVFLGAILFAAFSGAGFLGALTRPLFDLFFNAARWLALQVIPLFI